MITCWLRLLADFLRIYKKSCIAFIYCVNLYFFSEFSVPLERISETQLTLCHPEQELLPLVLANCNYSLEKGGETGCSYDLLRIQTQLCRRFLAGKPLIQTVRLNPFWIQRPANAAANTLLSCVSLIHIRTPPSMSTGTCRTSHWFSVKSEQRSAR